MALLYTTMRGSNVSMGTCKGRAGRDMSRIAILCAVVIGLGMTETPATPCSCIWRGPFLSVAKEAPLVVRGRILRGQVHPTPTMDVLVLETLSGGLLDSGLVVQMGDGMHCRPALENYPPGSEWILALNGPGAKPGKGWALSHCGEYSLRIERDEVVGDINGTQGEKQRMPLLELRRRFVYPKFRQTISGQVNSGDRFRRGFGGRFEFILEPVSTGWEIVVREYGRDENLARLTPPLHFVPNPRDIEGWHLADNPADCSGRPHASEAGPANPRGFIFSPEVGDRINEQKTGRAVTPEDIEAVRAFGSGTLTIGNFRLAPGKNGCPVIEQISFSVELLGGY